MTSFLNCGSGSLYMVDKATFWEMDKMLISSIFIRPSKTGRIMGSPVVGRRASGRRPVLCPEHISKTTLPRVMKFHGWIDLIQGECSVQES